MGGADKIDKLCQRSEDLWSRASLGCQSFEEVLVAVFFKFNRLDYAKNEVNFETFCVCPENGLSGKRIKECFI